jgi:hypothetical protein
MQKKINKYFSLFCLLLFLFPLAEKQVHAFHHTEDPHCLASDKHFHALEHNCSICDFTVTDSGSPAENNFVFITSEFKFSYNFFKENSHSTDLHHYLPARAPPLI